MFAKVQTDEMDMRVTSYLSIASSEEFAFFEKPEFMQAVVRYAETIQAEGAQTALGNFLLLQTQKEQCHA
jgi:hypothetical protein